jgi:hypothetical protein
LSFSIQVAYSFCWIRVRFLGITLPWQALAAQPPGPTYLPLTGGGEEISAELVDRPGIAQTANKVSDTSQHTLQRIVIVRSTRHQVALLQISGWWGYTTNQ